jgi:hypothetical protein
MIGSPEKMKEPSTVVNASRSDVGCRHGRPSSNKETSEQTITGNEPSTDRRVAGDAGL